jgi:phosphoglucomutase
MMDYYLEYQRWRRYPGMDPELKAEMDSLAGREEAIQEQFGRSLAFGTGGIRGPMGAGPARMNVYLIRKATAALADYLKEAWQNDRIAVAIAFDTRKNSARFAREAAAVLAQQGIEAWVFADPVPTPLLSYTVRYLKAKAGIVITASHNPPADNGYKVYGEDGGQITDAFAHAVMEKIAEVPDELAVPVMDLTEAEARGLLRWVPNQAEAEYLERIRSLSNLDHWWDDSKQDLKVVYTPLHGTGARHLPFIFENWPALTGIPVQEQMVMDATCPTVKYPNPEDWEVFEMAERLGHEHEADLLMATDLDADRLGVAVRNDQGKYIPLTGNQLGCLMLEYILSQRKVTGHLPANAMMVQTVVTSDLGKVIAQNYHVEVVETLTGFKYIGEVIKERGDSGRNTFVFGYEESYGYLVGDFVRDKDGLQGALFASEVAAHYKNEGKTLLDALDDLYRKYGYFQEGLININLPSGQTDKVDAIMKNLRESKGNSIGGSQFARFYDYLVQKEFDLLSGRKDRFCCPAATLSRLWLKIRPGFACDLREQNQK